MVLGKVCPTILWTVGQIWTLGHLDTSVRMWFCVTKERSMHSNKKAVVFLIFRRSPCLHTNATTLGYSVIKESLTFRILGSPIQLALNSVMKDVQINYYESVWLSINR